MKNEIKEQLKYMQQVKEKIGNKNLKYHIMTMGCQLNENDSEKISGMLEQMGYHKTDNIQQADIVIFNTCCVRENAEDKLFGKIGELKKQKETKGTILAIGGCMMQEKHMVEKIHKSYPYIDILFGTHTLYRIPEDINTILEQNEKKVEDIIDIEGEVQEGLPMKRNDKIKASVTIMYGCNNFCSYCIVPYVRGRERSRSPQDIINEVKQLARQGYREITLLGQNVNSYQGNGQQGIYEFSDLLRAVNQIEGIQRIRFISPHPKDFTQDVIEAIRDCPKICRVIHLPLQSGSSKVLKKMNRKYTKEQYLALAKTMKEQIPDIVFSTDIIVGFPGETEEDFKDTLDVVEKIHFEQVFMFIFSKRVGTPADTMENQIPEEIKHQRFDRLKELADSQVEENNQKYIGTIQEVLVEGKSKTNEEMLTGRTSTNKVVVFRGTKEHIHQMIPLKITSQHRWYLKGERI